MRENSRYSRGDASGGSDDEDAQGSAVRKESTGLKGVDLVATTESSDTTSASTTSYSGSSSASSSSASSASSSFSTSRSSGSVSTSTSHSSYTSTSGKKSRKVRKEHSKPSSSSTGTSSGSSSASSASSASTGTHSGSSYSSATTTEAATTTQQSTSRDTGSGTATGTATGTTTTATGTTSRSTGTATGTTTGTTTATRTGTTTGPTNTTTNATADSSTSSSTDSSTGSSTSGSSVTSRDPVLSDTIPIPAGLKPPRVQVQPPSTAGGSSTSSTSSTSGSTSGSTSRTSQGTSHSTLSSSTSSGRSRTSGSSTQMADWTSDTASSATSLDSMLESSQVYRAWEKASKAEKEVAHRRKIVPSSSSSNTTLSSSTSSSSTSGDTSGSTSGSSTSGTSPTSSTSVESAVSDISDFSFELAVSDAEELVTPLVAYDQAQSGVHFSTRARPVPRPIHSIADRINPALRAMVLPVYESIAQGTLLDMKGCANLLRCVGFGEVEVENARLGISNICPDGMAGGRQGEAALLRQGDALLRMIQERLILSGESLRAFVASRLGPLCSTQGPVFELHRDVFLRELFLMICPKELLKGVRTAVPTQPLHLLLEDVRRECERLAKAADATSPTEKNNAYLMYPDFVATWESVMQAVMLLSFTADRYVDLQEVLTHILPGDTPRKGTNINGLKFFLVPELVGGDKVSPHSMHSVFRAGVCAGMSSLAPYLEEGARCAGERLQGTPFYAATSSSSSSASSPSPFPTEGIVLRVAEIRNLKTTCTDQRLRIAITTAKKELHPLSVVHTIPCAASGTDWAAPEGDNAEVLLTYDKTAVSRYGILIELCSVLGDPHVEASRGFCFVRLTDLINSADKRESAKFYRIETHLEESINSSISIRPRRIDMTVYNGSLPSSPCMIPSMLVLPGASLDMEMVVLYREMLLEEVKRGALSFVAAHRSGGLGSFAEMLGRDAMWGVLRRDYEAVRTEGGSAEQRKEMLRGLLRGAEAMVHACGAAGAASGIAGIAKMRASAVKAERHVRYHDRIALLKKDDARREVFFSTPFLGTATTEGKEDLAKNLLDPNCQYCV